MPNHKKPKKKSPRRRQNKRTRRRTGGKRGGGVTLTAEELESAVNKAIGTACRPPRACKALVDPTALLQAAKEVVLGHKAVFRNVAVGTARKMTEDPEFATEADRALSTCRSQKGGRKFEFDTLGNQVPWQQGHAADEQFDAFLENLAHEHLVAAETGDEDQLAHTIASAMALTFYGALLVVAGETTRAAGYAFAHWLNSMLL